MKSIPYASAVGSLLYAQVCTRPDIELAIGLLGRYQSNIGLEHWKAAKKVMRYFQGTKDYSLTYRHTNHLKLVGYLDSDFAGYSMAKPIKIFCNNRAAICFSTNNKSGSKSKHIDIKYLRVREHQKE
ncbi:secreted RxLR effector protein 161-like [Corylus avellana]|uniref:secreted RxLR effector protein 161-like n=1 Tax=Corylus avellana TaxID=13451 RepID=UPI002869FDF1|nr:secreted RxLR effector protein 161-like [Corylus avellana]